MAITPEQSRAARGLLDWSQTELGEKSNLSESTIRDFEKGRRLPSPNNLAAIHASLRSAGIEFIAENGGGPGVRLQSRTFWLFLRTMGRANSLLHTQVWTKASSEAEARKFVSWGLAKSANADPNSKVLDSPWLNPELVACEEKECPFKIRRREILDAAGSRLP